MKSISKLYFAVGFVVLFVLLGSILFFKEETKSDNLQEIRKFVIEDFEEALAFEKANLLTFSLALAEDGALKKTLIEDDSDEGYRLLDSIAARFTEHTHLKKLRLQILNNDFEIFAQNWKQTSMGMPISWFRKDLVKLKENQKPKVGLETGRRLTFKATIPIINGEEELGYLEVIKFIDEFSEKLRQQGMEVFALMDAEYIVNKASLMANFPRFREYVIANENYNSKLLAKAKAIRWEALVDVSYYKHEDVLFVLKSMLNGEGKEVGQYLIVLPRSTLERYQKSRQNISLLTRFSDEDVHNFVKRWENPSGAYHNVHDRELIELLPKLFEEDKVNIKKLVRERLKDYSREELINIIVETSHKKKKTGKIE